MAGRSEVEKDLLKDGVESFINELPPEAARSTIKKILNSYLNLKRPSFWWWISCSSIDSREKRLTPLILKRQDQTLPYLFL
ncbi:MAG: hypothetical protein H8D61_01325 [Deltaproteobacteria bacterium]|nr:hypothetical protein [Deltaproteobacteria bacterium]